MIQVGQCHSAYLLLDLYEQKVQLVLVQFQDLQQTIFVFIFGVFFIQDKSRYIFCVFLFYFISDKKYFFI